MDGLKDVIWNVIKKTGIAMTFGAYQLYAMDEKWKLREEVYRLQDEKTKAMLEEMKELSKRK